MRWLALGIIALALAACTAPLGTDDVELVYRTEAGHADDGVVAARVRLETARLNADITEDGADTFRVRVASRYAATARRVLAWGGELAVLRFDPSHALAPADATDLVAHDGYFTGPNEAIEEAATITGDLTDRLVYTNAGEPRTWTVSRTPVVTPHVGLAGVDGTTVVVEIGDAEATAALARDGDTDVALVVASQVLWHGPLRDVLHPSSGSGHASTLVLPRGADLLGYTRARRTAAMLDAPATRPPALVERHDVDPQWPLALVCFAIPIAAGLLWLVFVRRFDPARPEPWWLVLATFAIGFASQRVAGGVEVWSWHASEYLDHRALAMDHRATAFPVSFALCFLVVGVVEEGAKLLATTFARRRREFDEPIDGIVYAAAAAIGFAAAENIEYFTDYRLADGITVSRSLLAMPGHVMMSAVWGYALGQGLLRRGRLRALGWFAVAAALHAAWDTAAEFRWNHASQVILAAQVAIFIVLVRAALRWGTVERHDAGGAAAASGARARYRVGQPMALVIAIVAMCAIGWGLMSLADHADLTGERLSWPMLVEGSALGVVFAAAAFAVARVMPLDVVVDDRGVTYAGALYPWSALRGVTRAQPWQLVLHRDGGAGDIRLGPGSRATMDKLDKALSARLLR